MNFCSLHETIDICGSDKINNIDCQNTIVGIEIVFKTWILWYFGSLMSGYFDVSYLAWAIHLKGMDSLLGRQLSKIMFCLLVRRDLLKKKEHSFQSTLLFLKSPCINTAIYKHYDPCKNDTKKHLVYSCTWSLLNSQTKKTLEKPSGSEVKTIFLLKIGSHFTPWNSVYM